MWGKKDGWKKQWLWLLGLWLLIWPWAEPPIVRQISRASEGESREEGVFYGPIEEREEWLERDEGGGTQNREGWSHSEGERERENEGDFILQQYIGRDARSLSSIKVCIQRGEKYLRLWNSLVLRLQSSATIITLAKCVVQDTWPLSTLYRLFGKSRVSRGCSGVPPLWRRTIQLVRVRLWQPWKTFLNP